MCCATVSLSLAKCIMGADVAAGKPQRTAELFDIYSDESEEPVDIAPPTYIPCNSATGFRASPAIPPGRQAQRTGRRPITG